MKIIEFMDRFPDEKSCRQSFKLLRESNGITCNKCGCPVLYWLRGKFQWQCSECTHRVTLKSGTIMHHSKLPLRSWFLAMALMSYSKKSISACNLKRQIGHKYEHVLKLMNKIRVAMGQENSMEDFHFSATAVPIDCSLTKLSIGNDQLKSILETQFPGFEMIPLGSKEQCPKVENYPTVAVRMELSEKSLAKSPKKSSFIRKKSTLCSNERQYLTMNKRYPWNALSKKIKTLFYSALGDQNENPYWTKIINGNFIRNLFGVHHKIEARNLRLYVDEFVFRLNRDDGRGGATESLMSAIAYSYW